MRRWRHFDREFGRVRVSGDNGLLLPSIGADAWEDPFGEVGAWISFQIGDGHCDPVFSVSIELDGTRAGRWLCNAICWWRERRG